LSDNKDIPDEFCLLQIKPMVIGGMQTTDLLTEESPEDILCKSDLVLGDGINQQIQHIIYVDPDSFDRSKTREIAEEIEVLNKKLGKDNPYMLIGPGRWGSSDPWLGVPVNWRQIANAKVIVEVGMDKLNPDPSFGSHFFQNVTSLQIGYFTISKRDHEKNVDWNWLANFTEKEQTTHLRLLELKHPLFVRIDGSKGEGLILKPKPPKQEQMDEELSSGI
ncbi:MAG: histidine kinase, partial [Candidatus Marinimicrobia bacterium]|nr:histidine kinase [Candidatus Neomarinimicrobiota bacterium]